MPALVPAHRGEGGELRPGAARGRAGAALASLLSSWLRAAGGKRREAGKKTAERLILELSDRMGGIETDVGAALGRSDGAQAAVQVLVALGMSFPDADRAVRAVLADGNGSGKADEIVRKVLANR